MRFTVLDDLGVVSLLHRGDLGVDFLDFLVLRGVGDVQYARALRLQRLQLPLIAAQNPSSSTSPSVSGGFFSVSS